MDSEDYANRWFRGIMGGKSNLERRLEGELAQRRAAQPKVKRPPLKWYWWGFVALGLCLWTALAFWADGLRA